jgi:hypothetical protein
MKGAAACQEKYTSTKNLKSVQRKLPKIDFAVGDNVIQSFGSLHDKPVTKPRVSKGKENRGIDLYTVDSTSNLGWLDNSNAKNDNKSCRRLSSDQVHENGSPRKKRSIGVVMNNPNTNTTYDLASKMNQSVSTCKKSSVSSCGSSRYFSYSQNDPKSSKVLIPESSCSSVSRMTYNKRKDNEGEVNGSIPLIVISDSSSSSSTSDASTHSAANRQMKHSLSSRTREQRNDVQKVRRTIVVDTSDSENDLLEASCEAPYRLNSNVKSPLHSISMSQTLGNTKNGKGPVADVEFTQTKYQDIKNWLSNVKSDKSDYDDADNVLEGNSLQRTEVTENSTKTSVGLNSSAEKILDNLYGTAWRKQNVNSKRHRTEPYKKKYPRNVSIARQHTERYDMLMLILY